MPIKIPFVADVARFLSGTKDAEGGLQDVSDSLDDLARKADLDADRIEHSFSDTFDRLKAEGRTATRKVTDDVDNFTHESGRAVADFKDEARQNLAESVSSFQGDASSAVDAVQSTFGGLATALGPAGVVGTVVAAAGIGLARGLFQKSKEAAAEVAEAVAQIAGELIELGQSSLDTAQVNAKLKEFATTAEDGTVRLNELARQARDAGIDFTAYARGVAGDNQALKSSYREVTGALDENLDALTAALRKDPKGFDDTTRALKEQRKALTEARDELVKQDGTLDQAAETARQYADATRSVATNTDEATARTKLYNDQLAQVPGDVSTDIHVTVPDLSGVDRHIRNYFAGKTYQFNVAPRPGKNVAT